MPESLPLRDAILLNGILAHGLDYDDTHTVMGHPTAPVLPALTSAHQGDHARLLIVDQVKMYSDGVPEYGTGRVIEPYAQTYFPAHPQGINYIPVDAMRSWLSELDQLGYGAHIHAVGDLGVFGDEV